MEKTLKQREIEEGNKLIAEFMEVPTCSDVDHADDKCYYFGKAGHLKSSEAKYHSSWDWLMPVIERIEQCGCVVGINFVLVCNCHIVAINGKKQSQSFINDNNGKKPAIEAVYKSVIDFLNWRNSLSPDNTKD